jgi:aldehyde dehydrogenase (NAD+)
MTTSPEVTPFPEIDRIFSLQRAAAARVAASDTKARRARIERLMDAVVGRTEEIHEAMWNDFRKPPAEVDLSEIWAVVGEAKHAMRHLRRWMRPRRVATRLALAGTRSEVRHEPKGVVLIISPWNFPFNLTFGPLVSAIAAGNCAIIKPSEITPHSSACMRRIVEECFDESEIAVVEGGKEIAEALLVKRFDHIFFTGSPAVGKIVMKAAAETLASVTLELGGKSPTIVDETANVKAAAAKIAWGKWINAGQTCIAPDYILAHEAIADELAGHVAANLERFRGEAAPGVAHVASERHHERIRTLYDEAVACGAKSVTGGEHGPERYFAPTLLTGVPPDCRLMDEEIFGPLLPLIRFSDLGEVIEAVNRREKPLALYLFSGSRRNIEAVLARTSAGTTVINDVLIQFFQLNLPFGGVNGSGSGRAHGRHGFETFSNERAILRQPFPWPATRLFYPPYTPRVRKFIELAVRHL